MPYVFHGFSGATGVTVSIAKAGKPPRGAPPPRGSKAQVARINALSEQMAGAVRIDLVKGIEKFRAGIDPEDVYEAWLTGDYALIREVIPFDSLDGDLDGLPGGIEDAAEGGFEFSRTALPAPVRSSLRWDTKNPRIREFISGRSTLNFTNLKRDSIDNIHRWVSASFNRALSPREVSQGIRDQIGILPRHAIALRRYAADLQAKGYPAQNIQKYTSARYGKLLDYRADMIARTETRLATNYGQLSIWQQAADQGLVDPEKAEKVWITQGPKPCDVCRPMNGVRVPLNGAWLLPDETMSEYPPNDVHPNCFCSFWVDYAGTPAETSESEG